MTADEFISRAIDLGQTGIGALTKLERSVFLISELEVLCDMEGIDSFLDRYEPDVVRESVEAFRSVGATEIADALGQIVDSLPARSETALRSANQLIAGRSGYEYESVRSFVDNQLRNAAS